jgi:GR25 family glycosyltransferase involved in LPS biosynthesis
MLTYLVTSKEEIERYEHVASLKMLFPNLIPIEAIYPSKIHVPFYNQIKSITKDRTGSALSDGALGCLLSHRVIWRRFLNQKDQDFCLILESDSQIDNLTIIQTQQARIKAQYDLFFWGAFDNRMKLLRSSKVNVKEQYVIGIPLINSLYCTYGYSINKTAAKYLLANTKRFNFPVDYWKLRLKNASLRVGGILPNIITTVPSFQSTISYSNKNLFSFIFEFIIDFKNYVISFFK